jgi:hypothetical protein
MRKWDEASGRVVCQEQVDIKAVFDAWSGNELGFGVQ